MLEIWEKNPEKLEETRKVLKETTGKEFVIPKNMVHASDLIYKFRNEIKARAKYRLVNKQSSEPLKVVDHVGCHYAKYFLQGELVVPNFRKYSPD